MCVMCSATIVSLSSRQLLLLPTKVDDDGGFDLDVPTGQPKFHVPYLSVPVCLITLVAPPKYIQQRDQQFTVEWKIELTDEQVRMHDLDNTEFIVSCNDFDSLDNVAFSCEWMNSS
eukprot:scaffold414_cov109-Cylindrotheca_fusiformis.AAC.2